MTPRFALSRRPRSRRLALVAGGLFLLLVLATALRLGIRSSVAGGDPLDEQGRRFVSLALAFGQTDEKEVDAYFGPASLKPEVGSRSSLEGIAKALEALAADIAGDAASDRRDRLASRVLHLRALIESIRNPRSLSFDEEARRVYALDPVPVDAAAMAQARADLEHLLPGPGPLAARVDAYLARFVIPEDKREAVFARALAECRRRTLAHWPLPAQEKLEVEWTSTVDAAWHRYRGGYRSLLQINPQAVALLGSAVDVACHEGYPGHHAQFVMQEAAAGPAGLPVEDRIVLLRSPETMLREGAANYGIDLAFPPAERLAFERDVLFPLAGPPRAEAARFEQVRAAIDRLSAATAPILRDYRDGRLPGPAAAEALRRDAFVISPEPLLGFVDALGPYALGYTIARNRIGANIARRAGGGDRWNALGHAVAGPDITFLSDRPEDRP